MPKYVLETLVPGVGRWSAKQLRAASRVSCEVLGQLGPNIEWLQSYVTDDKLFSLYNAPSEEIIREHARLSGFPADSVQQVRTIIGPFTSGRSNK